MFADLTLARRLERAEGEANRRYVEARARVEPAVGAGWMATGGAYVLFDGVDSPLTQTFGLGMFEPATSAHLDRIERFFGERRSTTFHEVSPLAEAVLPLLHARGYEPFEFSSVLYRPLGSASAATVARRALATRVIEPSELTLWAETAAEGWAETPELRDFMLGFGRITAAAEGVQAFVAEMDGRPAATAALVTHGGVALLAGASTVPAARGRGAQNALLDARLEVANAQGCDLAMMVAQPGSASQRNAERNGFRLAYTRLKWRRPPSA